MVHSDSLSARMEPFDSFWEAPGDIEKGFKTFGAFYSHNYMKHLPDDRNSSILVVSSGYGYFVRLLNDRGYRNVVGIDSDPEKIDFARKKNIDCRRERAFEFFQNESTRYDVIILEQEVNHLSKTETLEFLALCYGRLKDTGRLIAHGLCGANPITGSEAFAQNFDHFYMLTDYSFTQMLEYAGFKRISVFPLFLYVFWANPLNYVLIAVSECLNVLFRCAFMLYGKKNKIFSKKIGAIAYKQ